MENIPALYNEAYKKVAKNFYEQTKLKAFVKWDIERVCGLLGNDFIIIEVNRNN
jgi:hypothetical protein